MKVDWAAHVVSYAFKIPSQNYAGHDDESPALIDRMTQEDGSFLWAVKHGGRFVLDKQANRFVFDPMGSWRPDDYRRRCRFKTKEAAYAALQRYCKWAVRNAKRLTREIERRKKEEAAEEP